MIVDTSAVLAILKNEPDAIRFSSALEADMRPAMSVVNYVEAAMVIDSARNPRMSRRLDELIQTAGIEIRPVSLEQGRIAREAYRDFGRGSGHPARLNFGDCFAYALAKACGQPLLYKGSDFGETDVDGAG